MKVFDGDCRDILVVRPGGFEFLDILAAMAHGTAIT